MNKKIDPYSHAIQRRIPKITDDEEEKLVSIN
jgi:hypothetical protein